MFSKEEVDRFLTGYGLNPHDPVSKAELFGNFQEALQFVKHYFLKEGSKDGLDLKMPASFFTISEISDLFIMATRSSNKKETEEQLWAEIILKVMHTILHIDKDLRSNYFSSIQQQIFDKFYKYVFRDTHNELFLGTKGSADAIPLVDFATKAKKSRDSVIIKLLHKVENVAEELFDRVGVRIVTKNKLDILRVIKFLTENYVIIPHNIKPSRSVNSLIDLHTFRAKYRDLVKRALRENLSEEDFFELANKEISECLPEIQVDRRNKHSLKSYRSIQFTCRQLIKYKNPFVDDFLKVREMARKASDDDIMAQKILALDSSSITRHIRFFYPFEVQIIDAKTNQENFDGEASHKDYKNAQVISARNRLFKKLAHWKGISLHRESE